MSIHNFIQCKYKDKIRLQVRITSKNALLSNDQLHHLSESTHHLKLNYIQK